MQAPATPSSSASLDRLLKRTPQGDKWRKDAEEFDRLLDEQLTRSIQDLGGFCKPGGLKLFTKHAWPILEPYQPFIDNWHIGAICETLEAVTRGDIKDVIITIPPRHSKSLIVAVMWPCWEWGPADLAHLRWLFSAYAQSLSARDSMKRRKVIASVWYQSRWADRFVIGGAKWIKDTGIKYENDRTGYMLATSVKGTNTGEGGNRIVVDDPINVKEAFSDTIRETTNNWWDTTMSTRRNNPATDARVIIMQRTHERDIPGHVMAKKDHGYHLLSLPTEFVPTKRSTIFIEHKVFVTDPRQEPNELLNPNRFGPKEINEAKRDLGDYGYSAQHQQEPSPADGGILKKMYWKWYVPEGHPLVGTKYAPAYGLPETVVEPLPKALRPAWSWDASFKDKEHNDPVCGTKWGYNIDRTRAYLLAEKHDRMGFADTADAVLSLWKQWRGEVLIEDKANGTAIIDHLANKVSGLLPVDPGSRSKVERAHAVSPYCKAGNVYLPHPEYAPWILAFVHELTVFPNGAHDDRVDSTTQFLEWLFGGVKLTAGQMTADVDV